MGYNSNAMSPVLEEESSILLSVITCKILELQNAELHYPFYDND